MNLEDISQLKTAKKAGCSYAEGALNRLVDMTYDRLAAVEENLAEADLPCLAVNCFFPSDFTLTGDNVDYEKIADYVSRALALSKKLGFKTAVFGSGKSRSVLAGYSREKAVDQLLYLCTDIIAPAARENGVTVAIETLNSKETNIFTTCAETVEFLKLVNMPEIRLLVDFYHVMLEGENISSIGDYGEFIVHTHIASPSNRRAYPAPNDGDDYAPCFAALKKACYTGFMSIEGNAGANFEYSVNRAFEVFGEHV